MRTFCSILALSVALSTTALAQPAAQMTSAEELQAAQAQAQADAIHPGDDQLTCDQLQAEMTSTMQDPAMRANLDEMGETARAQQQRAHDMQAHAVAQAAPSIITGVVASFIPGAGYAQMAMQQAQMRQQQADAAQGQQETAQMMGNMSAMMPQMMRGSHLYELAQGKQCAFLQQTGAPPPQ